MQRSSTLKGEKKKKGKEAGRIETLILMSFVLPVS